MQELLGATLCMAYSTVFVEFVIGHPFDAIKTKLQATTCNAMVHQPTASQLLHTVVEAEGLRGVYRGGTANFMRMAMKATYRYPARPMIKRFYKNSFGFVSHHLNVATGLSMSLLDVLIVAPAERLKVWKMTQPSNGSSAVTSFIIPNLERGTLRVELFRGFRVSLLRSAISWSTFLVVEEHTNDALAESGYDMFRRGSLFTDTLRCVVTGLVGGSISSALILPFDSAKTQFQKFNSVTRESLLGVMVRIYKCSGVRGLYSGWQVRLPHYILVGLIQAQVMPRIDALWGVRKTNI